MTTDIYTPQLENCFLVEWQLIYVHRNFKTASLYNDNWYVYIPALKLLPCRMKTDIYTPQL